MFNGLTTIKRTKLAVTAQYFSKQGDTINCRMKKAEFKII